VIVATEGATFHDLPHFVGGIVPGDGLFTTWSYRAGAGRAEAFLLNPQPLPAHTAQEWGVVAEVVPNGKALSRARELAELYLKAPEVTRRNTRIHFIQPLKERIVREVGYGLSLEGASAAHLVKSMEAKGEPVARKKKICMNNAKTSSRQRKDGANGRTDLSIKNSLQIWRPAFTRTCCQEPHRANHHRCSDGDRGAPLN